MCSLKKDNARLTPRTFRILLNCCNDGLRMRLIAEDTCLSCNDVMVSSTCEQAAWKRLWSSAWVCRIVAVLISQAGEVCRRCLTVWVLGGARRPHRGLAKLLASPTAATRVVALSTPSPGIDVGLRIVTSLRARAQVCVPAFGAKHTFLVSIRGSFFDERSLLCSTAERRMFLINVFEEETLCQRWERWRLCCFVSGSGKKLNCRVQPCYRQAGSLN